MVLVVLEMYVLCCRNLEFYAYKIRKWKKINVFLFWLDTAVQVVVILCVIQCGYCCII